MKKDKNIENEQPEISEAEKEMLNNLVPIIENKEFVEDDKEEHIKNLIEAKIYSKYNPGKQKAMLYKLLFIVIKAILRVPIIKSAFKKEELDFIGKCEIDFLDMRKTVNDGKQGKLKLN